MCVREWSESKLGGGVFRGATKVLKASKVGGIKKFAPKWSIKKYPKKRGATKNFGTEGAEEWGGGGGIFNFQKIYSSPLTYSLTIP